MAIATDDLCTKVPFLGTFPFCGCGVFFFHPEATEHRGRHFQFPSQNVLWGEQVTFVPSGRSSTDGGSPRDICFAWCWT